MPAPAEALPKVQRGGRSPFILTGSLRQGGRAPLVPTAALRRGGRGVHFPC